MPSGLVTVWIMHNKPPEEFTHTHKPARTHSSRHYSNTGDAAAPNFKVRCNFSLPTARGSHGDDRLFPL